MFLKFVRTSIIRKSSISIRKIVKHLFFILCCLLSFICGNYFTLLTMDSNHMTCIETLKKDNNLQEDLSDSMLQWQRNINHYERQRLLVIIILSSLGNIEQRNIIRQTWLSHESMDTIHYFILGTINISEKMNGTIQSEQKKFGDIMLLDNVYDSYETLTNKLLEGIVYVYRNVKFKYLLKVDDDSYVNVPQLILELKHFPHKHRLYWGYFDGRATPRKSGQWKETNWFLCDRYLPYALGGGYLISSDLVTFIAVNSRYLQLYNGEDVSIGTWLAPLNIHRVHDSRFDTEYMSRGCNNKYLISHKQNIILMQEKFSSIQTRGNLCNSEFKVRNSYNYNWNVKPSECCIRNDSKII